MLPRVQRHSLAPPPKIQLDRDGAVHGLPGFRYQKTRKQLSHSLLQNYQHFGCGTTFMSGIADVRTRKSHSQKFRHIGYNVDQYGQSFFPNRISAWNGLAKDITEANTLDIFKFKLQN